jgi:hypothetical protein
MRKRFIQGLVGLVMLSALVLGPIAPGAMARRAGRQLAPAAAREMRTLCGWDHGPSTAT